MEGTVASVGTLLDGIDALVRQAVDHRASLEQRRAAAMLVCEQIHASGALDKAKALRAWFAANRGDFLRGLKAARTLDGIRKAFTAR